MDSDSSTDNRRRTVNRERVKPQQKLVQMLPTHLVEATTSRGIRKVVVANILRAFELFYFVPRLS